MAGGDCCSCLQDGLAKIISGFVLMPCAGSGQFGRGCNLMSLLPIVWGDFSFSGWEITSELMDTVNLALAVVVDLQMSPFVGPSTHCSGKRGGM